MFSFPHLDPAPIAHVVGGVPAVTPRFAIVGSGPTGLYVLRELLGSPLPLDLTLLETQAEAGWGMPFSPERNGPAMLSNIAGIEIPPVTESLVRWVSRQPDTDLARLNIPREQIDERAFYPRVLLGEFFRSQLLRLAARARDAGHRIEILSSHRVADIELRATDILLTIERGDGTLLHLAFGHVVAATGHTFAAVVETRPGWFASPYPTTALRAIEPVTVGLRGSSLPAIDAAVAIAQRHGVFLRDAGGLLKDHPKPDTEGLGRTLLSRKSLLPEADFYFPIPYEENVVCTPEAVDALIETRGADPRDASFELFREELLRADPDDAARIGLAALDADSFAPAYLAERDPFAWAALNLAEAKANYKRQVVVPWRYAILRMHEVVARIVPHLSAEDLQRFHGGWKAVFVDDYATVPHESIEPLLARHGAGRVGTLGLGPDYELMPSADAPGSDLAWAGGTRHFDAFVEATGQTALDAGDPPFATLLAQDAVRHGRADRDVGREEDQAVEAGGVDLDEAFRPVNDLALHQGLHLLALPFLLHLRPFHQGLTSAEELGQVAAHSILAAILPGKAAPGPVGTKHGGHSSDHQGAGPVEAWPEILRA